MDAAFLGVERSLTGKRWVARPYAERVAEGLAQRFRLPDLVARSLAARGLTLETAASFIEPKLRDLLPDPSRFVDMDVAATRLAHAIQHNEAVAIFGDYDVDGGTSSALLLRFGKSLHRAFRLYIPDRITEGYGPNAAAMRQLAAEGVKLVICVDCGTTAHEPLQAAKDADLDVIVIDHHTAEANLPPAVAIVNPNRLDDPNSEAFGTLAAVGMTYLFVVAVNRALRMAGFYTATQPEPDLKSWLDLVALGTVCDVVKLTGLNRAYVAQGLKIMAQRHNVGLSALARVAGAKNHFDTYAAGFLLGPRVNAGGRVGRSDLGARLLASDDGHEAQQLAEQLHQHNAERRTLEAEALAEAENMALQGEAPLVLVVNDNWHPGVIGIVASRLKDRFQRPAIVIALDGEIGKGSGRSIGNIDLGAMVIAARQAGLLINGGGHKMAAGLTVAREKLSALQEFLADRIGRQLAAEPLVATLSLDGLISGTGMTVDFVDQLLLLAPFGTGNSEPRFALADCRVVRADVVGEKHVSVIFQQGSSRIRAIAFRALETELGTALLQGKGRGFHLAGHIRADEWNGERRVQLFLDDAAFA